MTETKRSLPSWAPIAAIIAGAVVVMLLLWALVIKADDESSSGGAEIVSASELSDAVSDIGHPVYWVGEQPGTSLELTESDSGRVYIRYLDEGVDAGTRSADFMTVATYPVEDAVAALRRGKASRPGSELARDDGGALVLIDPKTPGSVRLAYPGSDEQIELYTPDVKRSIRLATNGSIQPVP